MAKLRTLESPPIIWILFCTITLQHYHYHTMALHLSFGQVQHGRSEEDIPHNPRREPSMSSETHYATTGYEAQVATPAI